ncbi:MAG: DUF4198 domain-containing protein [Steroidobacteraceae bacterium]
MNNRTRLRLIATGACAATLLPLAAHAARNWLLPSSTNVTGNNAWVTVDAAGSDDLFHFDHNALDLEGLKIYAPDGTLVAAQNKTTSKFRSTFDVQLNKPGTWRISLLNDNAIASYTVGTESKRARGTMASIRQQIPADATEVAVTRTETRFDVFVTSGKPSDTMLKPTGAGLELVAYSHPTDLVAGDKASFGLVFDGKPAVGAAVTVIRGGNRYRDQLGDIRIVADKDGRFSVTWPEAGMYWLNATYPPRAEGETPAAAPGGTVDAPARRATYTATLEVATP